MKGIALTRFRYLVHFTNILNEMGAHRAPLRAKFRLPTHPEEKPNHFMPLFPALRFVTTVQVLQGVMDYGFYAGQRLGLEALNERFQRIVRHSPTLLAALRSWCKFIQLKDTFLRVFLERHGDSLRICTANTFPGAEGMLHLEHAQWIQSMVVMSIVRQFAGPDWTPENFAFQARHTPSVETQSFWPDTRFLSGQKATWIDVPVSLLSHLSR
jgi:Arabinose-binding domain of AraC transcription regulator, N-term